MPPRSRDPQRTSTPDQPPTTTPGPEIPTAPTPGFQRIPEPEPEPDPNPSRNPSRPAWPDDDAAARLDPDGSDPAPTPEPPTSRRPRFGPVDAATRDALLGAAGMVLRTIGLVLQLRFANPKRYGPNSVFIPDEQDQEAIGGALANLGARRIPAGLGAAGDVADLLQLAVGTAGYAGKNALRRMELVDATKLGAWSEAEQAEPAGPFAGPDLAAGAA